MLLCAEVGTATARAGERSETPALFLHTEFLPYARPIKNPLSTRLVRELVRQAILIAVRDEMGWVTRDESLQEDDLSHATVVHIMPLERGDEEGKWQLKLVSAEEGTQWETAFEVTGGGQPRMVELVKTLEAESRGELLAGFARCRRGWNQATGRQSGSTRGGSGGPVKSSRCRGSIPCRPYGACGHCGAG